MYASPHDRPDGILWLLLFGPFALIHGLRTFNEKRLIENTPTSKVRSAAMGPVELAGIARWRKPQKAPMSGMDCCWWDCQVQELRSSGKDRHWATIHHASSVDLFYLDDTTGRVLVSPLGAELHILKNTFDLNASTRIQFAPVLTGWGLDDMNWFGGERRLRILESVIPDCAPIFVMGELISLVSHVVDRQARFRERMRAVKADPARMAEADANHDGTVDAEEWDAFRARQEDAFITEELARAAQQPPQADTMLVQAPDDRPFIISTGTEGDLLGSFRWLAPLGVIGGITMSALGVAWALSETWEMCSILGLLAIGLVGGVVFKKFKLDWGGFSS
jgi:hypothetical protein